MTHNAISIQGLRQISSRPRSKESFALEVDDYVAISKGSFVGILGQTGCGKTTLLTVLGLLRGATPGSSLVHFEMMLSGDSKPTSLVEIWRSNHSPKATQIRRQHIGFALQEGELMSNLTVKENISFPLKLNGWDKRKISDRIDELISGFNLYRSISADQSSGSVSSLADSEIHLLSGGQRQRVALARAVAHRPAFVFVDEPTASLNRKMATESLDLLAKSNTTSGDRVTIIMVTHDEYLANKYCDQVIRMDSIPNGDRQPLVSASGGVVKIESNKTLS